MLKKLKTLSIMMFSVLIFMALFAVNSLPVWAVEQCGGITDDCLCNAHNPFPCDGGNCTWWAWHKVCCNWGEDAAREIAYNWTTPRDAHTWNEKASASSSVFTVSSYPSSGSIAVREQHSDNSYYGYVAWVESVSGTQVTVTEMLWGVSLSGGYRTKTYDRSYFDGGYITLKNSSSCNDSKEPNEDFSAAIAVNLNSSIASYICSGTDVDWFKVPVSGVGTLKVD